MQKIDQPNPTGRIVTALSASSAAFQRNQTTLSEFSEELGRCTAEGRRGQLLKLFPKNETLAGPAKDSELYVGQHPHEISLKLDPMGGIVLWGTRTSGHEEGRSRQLVAQDQLDLAFRNPPERLERVLTSLLEDLAQTIEDRAGCPAKAP